MLKSTFILTSGASFGKFGTAAQKHAKPALYMFQISTFAVVEEALAAAYDVAPKNRLALRSRLGALQRGGLFGVAPGKGRRLAYGADTFHRLVFALELTAWNIAPSLILELVRDFWDNKLRAIFSAAESAITHPTDGGDIALVLIGGDQMFRSRPSATALRLTHAPLRELRQCMGLAMRDNPLPARAVVVNLSARLRRFHTALADAHNLREPVTAPEPPRKAARKPKRRKRT
jgi:hypothetical protein